MIFVVTGVLGFAFGAFDQWLGILSSTTHLGGWTDSVSLMSAPWLALPFLAGWRAPDRRRAVLLGVTVTMAALCGYFAMTLSPFEGVTASQIHLTAFARSQLQVIVPGLLTGPLFGWLGNRWRTSRSWLSATAVVIAFCGEPLVRWLVRQPIPAARVAAVEVAIGVAVAAYFAVHRRTDYVRSEEVRPRKR
jgi:hypothetical protein